MKPAIETPGGASPDPFHKTVCCLRCEQRLERYQLMRASLAPGTSGHAILSCPRCGHVEFVSGAKPPSADPRVDLGRHWGRRLITSRRPVCGYPREPP